MTAVADSCFAGEFTQYTKVLVLGSLPGQASLAAQQYYAHPRNSFWPIMSELFHINTNDYDERLAQLKAADIGLWDVYANAVRPGSLDAAIEQKTAVLNDFSEIKNHCPALALIACNGKKAFEVFSKKIWSTIASEQVKVLAMPSTSPAYAAMSFEQKLSCWSVIKDYL